MRERAHKYLINYGIRPSLQRLAVMEYLFTHKSHPTADEIFAALFPLMPTLSKTTIYNTLNALAEQKAIIALDLDPKQIHYDGDNTIHAHFICTECQLIIDIPLDGERFKALTEGKCPEGAELFDVQLTYKGVCRKCINVRNPN